MIPKVISNGVHKYKNIIPLLSICMGLVRVKFMPKDINSLV